MASWKSIMDLRSGSKKLYIYGAGQYGRDIYKALLRRNIAVDGFLVTTQESEVTSLFGLPVQEFKATLDPDIGIIVGVNRLKAPSIIKHLKSNKFSMKKVVLGWELFDKQVFPENSKSTDPAVEITTRIGCKVNCKFCPQNTLLHKYFENDANRASVMSMETFSKCLEKLPQDCAVLFCGMAEPLLNPECMDMIKLAVSSSRNVRLYTTLVDANVSLVEQLSEIPLEFIVLHLADKYGYASIPVSDEYYKIVDMLVNMKRKDGSPLVRMCFAQAEPDEKLLQICEGKYEVVTTMHDRAGHLNDPQLLKKNLSGPISCYESGSSLDHTVLLPDGTLLLCCMDYGMKHILGNLLENSYEELLNGHEMSKVKRGMLDEGIDILCRHCTYAQPYSATKT